MVGGDRNCQTLPVNDDDRIQKQALQVVGGKLLENAGTRPGLMKEY